MTIEQKYNQLCRTPSDINEHLPVLYSYAKQCHHVTEMGVRGFVSTYAFMRARPEKLVSYDIADHPNSKEAHWAAHNEGIDFTFHIADVLKTEIEETDLLFIDTLHIYAQLKQELRLHAAKVRKYIILHDTTTYGDKPEPCSWYQDNEGIMSNYVQNDKGLWPAVEEFLRDNKNWIIEKRLHNNNGLTILRRV